MKDRLALRQAFLILHRRLDRATLGSDPAPWHEAIGGDPRKRKIEAAVTRAVRIGLLDGSLNGFWAVDGVAVPAWVWEAPTSALSRPHLSALLPPEWNKYRGEAVGSLDRRSFRRWLQRVDLTPVEGEPALPLAVDGDSRPAPLDLLLPPDEGFVNLGHALSWAAWSISLPAHWWDDAVARGELGPDAKKRLDTALAGLLRLGRKDELAFAGRYSPRYPDDARDTLPIDRHKLQDFGRYDTLRDGLQRGSGFAWGGPGTAFDELFDGPADGFAQVVVDRAKLLAHYPVPGDSADLDADKVNVAPIDPQAPAAINRDKDHADQVAQIIRTRGGTVSSALREVMPSPTRNVDLPNAHSAIRKSLVHYYDKLGRRKI